MSLNTGTLIAIDKPHSRAGRVQLHQKALAGMPYWQFVGAANTPFLKRTAIAYAGEMLQRMKPRDDMEAMLVSQALWSHGRLLKLNMMLGESSRVNDVRILSDLIDRAANSFRKTMLSLREYRGAKRPRVIRQVNNAHQQVVQNNGGDDGPKITGSKRRKALPAANQSRGTGRTQAKNSRGPAVETRHGAAKRRR